MKKPKIQTVCGYGCGSSLMLRMNVETIAKPVSYTHLKVQPGTHTF